MVLHVARASLGIGDERVDGALALELAKDRRVRAADDVRQDVEATAMCDPDEHLVRAALRRELDRLVEHRHEHVETLDGELLLADERTAQVRLEPFDLREPVQQCAALVRRELGAEAARLDRLPQPDALGVIGDVLDLVRDRPRVDLAQARERVEQCLSRHREPEQAGRDPRLQLRRQRRLEPRFVERGVAHRLRPEWVEAGIQVPVHPVRLDERHRRGDSGDQLRVGSRLDHDRTGRRRRRGGAGAPAQEARRARLPRPERPGAVPPQRARLTRRAAGSAATTSLACEDGSPRRVDGLGIVEVLLEQLLDVAGVEAGGLERGHRRSSAGTSRSRCPSGPRRSCRGRTRPRDADGNGRERSMGLRHARPRRARR